MGEWLPALIAALLGGGLVQGISTLHKSIVEGRKEKVLTTAIGIKTPLETESLALSNMAVSLQAAENRILAMQRERQQDQEYYLARINELQGRLTALTTLHDRAQQEHEAEQREHQKAMLLMKRELDIAVAEAASISSELHNLRKNSPPPEMGG